RLVWVQEVEGSNPFDPIMTDGSHYVYVLRSTITGRLYVGSTSDLQDRLFRHNNSESKATRHGVPWVLIHHESFGSRSQAVRRELYYKTGKGRDELKKLVVGCLN